MELFKKMGPRVILVEHLGHLQGLITVKDCLRYQVKAQALEHSSHHTGSTNDNIANRREEYAWTLTKSAAQWLADRINNLSRGRLRLSPRTATASDPTWSRLSGNEPAHDYQFEDDILAGTEDLERIETRDSVEMDVR